jgi:epsilon-lactone hydrolase
MPSLAARLTGFVLRTTGLYRRMYTGGPSFGKNIAKVRAERLAEPNAKAKVALLVEQTDFQGRPVWKLSPKDKAPTAHLLYWHGGGYVYPATPVHWAFLVNMAKHYGWSITAPLYPLAPETTAAETTAFALDFYTRFAEKNPQGFIMGGDSAGGGLAAVTAQMARDAQLPLPSNLILICPWLDLKPTNPAQQIIEARDGILTISGIAEAGLAYAGSLPLTDPRCSPIHGEWGGLPPILSFGGGDDILVVDARALKAKLPSVDYVEEAGLIHDWPIFTFAESKAAQKRMASFVSKAYA